MKGIALLITTSASFLWTGCSAPHRFIDGDAEGDPDGAASRDGDVDEELDGDRERDVEVDQEPDAHADHDECAFASGSCGEEPELDCGEEPFEVVWSTSLPGGAFSPGSTALRQTSDGGFVVATSTGDWGAWREDIVLVKVDSDGNEEWRRVFGGPEREWAHAVRQTNDGGFIIAGMTFTSSAGFPSADYILIKTDAEGSEVWTRTFGGADTDEAYSVEQTSDAGYIVAGRSYLVESGTGHWDALVIKTDPDGTEEWRGSYGGSGYDSATHIRQVEDGGYIFTGRTTSFTSVEGAGDAWLVRIDGEGDEVWNWTFGLADDYIGADYFERTADGGFILAGATDPGCDHIGCTDALLVKVDCTGSVEWVRTFGLPTVDRDDAAYSVAQTSDCGFVIAGETASYGAGDHDGWIVRTDANGNELWSTTFGLARRDEFGAMVRATDGSYVVAGFTDVGWDEYDIWLMRLCIE